VGGEYENYVTPEGHVPDSDLGVPWETCMPMGTSWSWVPNEKYKSTDEIIRTLVNVVSRGGSLLLNVAPGPDGQLDSMAYVRLNEVGEWLKVNGEAVYGTRGAGDRKTRSQDGSEYAFFSLRADETQPSHLTFTDRASPPGEEVTILGCNTKIKWGRIHGQLAVEIPAITRTAIQGKDVTLVVKLTP
jgi:alpha-L-fucosidase